MVDTTNLGLYQNDGVFVAYDWEWMDGWSDENEDLFTDLSEPVSKELNPHTEIPQLISDESDLLHTVAFKCSDATRDSQQQHVLKEVYQLIESNETVSVRIEPEPSNPYDAKACLYYLCWRQMAKNWLHCPGSS